MDNILELRTINDLRNYTFFIPSYQRGYRWTDKEVIELLDDISDFIPKEVGEDDERTWYCLQPLVIRSKDDGKFEVIDGQQRLTTIYLILYFLNQMLAEDFREKLFEIEYETRKGSASFLKKLKKGIEEESNIDFYYISKAYNAIANWFNKNNFNRNEFESKFKFYTKVIWYETIELDSISIFTRINIGKIPLTNAELIKALFLNSSNFEKDKSDKIRLKQLEISSEWDRIEHSLQNNDMWYFLNGSDNLTNRIELIFNLMNKKRDKDDVYSTFRFFYEKFRKKTKDTIENNWNEIKIFFQTFEEWFTERDLYHKIGFLLVTEHSSILDLMNKSQKMSKRKFKIYLDELIQGKFKDVSIEDLQYGDKHLKPIFLLYNIQTMLNNKEDNSRFPFQLYLSQSWDIEHITSINDSIPEGKKQESLWLEDALNFIENDNTKLKEKVKKFLSIDDSKIPFKNIFEEVVEYFNKDVKDKDLNDISNLALLDSKTNRGYKNAVFPIKRKTIITREKEGTFIPICTKNVFLKYFSEYPPKISFWSQEDRENYLNDLVNILSDYLITNNENDNE